VLANSVLKQMNLMEVYMVEFSIKDSTPRYGVAFSSSGTNYGEY
jgi:hypothetical protein